MCSHCSKDPKEIEQLASQMLGYNIITKQTPPEGVKVNRLMVAHALDIKRETYFAIVMDRETGRSRGFAFVEMASEQDSQAAMNALHEFALGGRPLVVNEARERAPRTPHSGGPRASYSNGPRPGGYASRGAGRYEDAY